MLLAPLSGSMDANKAHILIVDDELGPRESLKMILNPYYHVHVAERGLLSALGNGAPWFGIDAFGAHHCLGNVYLRHHALLYASIADRLA